MIQINLVIKELKVDVPLFFIEASKNDHDEIMQAIRGEVYYNETEYDFGKLNYYPTCPVCSKELKDGKYCINNDCSGNNNI